MIPLLFKPTKKRLWTPERLNALSLWLDAKDPSTIQLNSSSVSQWNDKSGSNRHAVQSLASKQPLLLNDYISFDGLDDFLTVAHALTLASIFVVCNTNESIFPNFNGLVSGVSQDTTNLNWSATGNTTTVRTLQVNGVSTGNPVFINGVFTNNFSPNTTSIKIISNTHQTPTLINGVNIASDRENNDRYWNGSFMEVIILSNNYTTEERQKIEGYLAHKWNLAANLPATHPYKYRPPVV